jgi:AP-4 complex subunit beta-1
MLRDADAQVVANCVICLNEVMQKSPAGGMAINRAIMLHLLNRIHEFNEFAKVQILELVPRYIPANDEEGFQIMNLLDPVLSTSGSGAVMATVRAFLSLAEQVGDHDNAMKRQIVERVKPCLVTQISSGSSEMMYTLLKHVESLADVCPGVFDDEYRQFYVRYNEPTHVKYLKLSILPRLANRDTAPDIVSGATTYSFLRTLLLLYFPLTLTSVEPLIFLSLQNWPSAFLIQI